MRSRVEFQRLLATVLATLVLWTPLSVTIARAQERAQQVDAKEAVQAAAEQSVAHGLVREHISVEDSIEAAALAEGMQVPESALNTADGQRDEPELASEPEGDAAKDPQSPVVPLNLPSGPSKTAVTPQQVALPKGEGSIQGMGESFTPNLSSGTGTFSVPIALPKGRAGVQPSLALSYATSGGNGIVGIGWSLAMPFISRQTDKGLPHYVDAAAWHAQEDTFMYNGGQELVPIDSAAAARMEGAPVPAELTGWQQYRARVEGGFMRFFRAPDSLRWVVQSKDGTRFEFGDCVGTGTCTGDARQADPEDAGKVFSWQLVRMSDVHGSTVHYAYTKNGGMLYPESLHYTSPASCAAHDSTRARNCAEPLSRYAFRVGLVYEPRPDVTSSYLTTWRTEQAMRLKRVEITAADAEPGTRFLVRRYHLSYESSSYHSLMSQVQVEGRPSTFNSTLAVKVGNALVPEGELGTDIVGELLPPMRFSYTSPAATSSTIPGFGGIDATVHHSAASPDHSADEGRVDFFDVNSDGLPDLLVTDPARYAEGAGVYFNGFPNGAPGQAGAFSEGQGVDVPEGLAGTLNLSNLNVLPMDVDGDGRVDVLHMPKSANYGYFVLSKLPARQGQPYTPLEDWSFHHVTDLLPTGVTDPRIDLGKDGLAVKTLDLNGDHLIDVVRTTGTVMQSWLNLGRYPGGDGRFGQATYTGRRWVLSTDPVESCLSFAGRSLDFGASHVRIADMNGDGLEDIVKIAPDSVVWWPGRGEGAFGDGDHDCDQSNAAQRELRMQNPPQELNVELAGLELVDVNHDGATDFVQVGSNHLSIWFNQGGEALTDRILVKNTPFASEPLNRVRVADIDGSSTVDLVYAESGDYRWIDPMGGVKPRLLKSVDNGLGALTTLRYSSSIVDYLRDLAEAKTCDPAALDCFTWQREPLLPGEREADCDARVMEKSGTCVHRAGGSPVVSAVVRSVSTTDRLNALGAEETVSETEYRYHDGYYEGIEQEFRGFGAADAVAVGDSYEPTSLTRTYFHQGRRPNEIAADRLADNPNEALKGREFLTEIWNETGLYLTTSHATYAVRQLMKGLNDVGVSYAYVKSSDEFRYDTSLTGQRKGPTSQLPSVVREQAGAGLDAVVAGRVQAGDAPHALSVRELGYVHLRTSIDRVDNVGNLLEQTAWGRAGRGEFAEVVGDERIVQHAVPARVQDVLCGGSAWLWRTAESWVSGANGAERLGHTTTRYNPCGDAVAVRRFATLPSVGGFNFDGDGRSASYTQTAGEELSTSQFDPWGQPTAQCGGAEIESGFEGCLRLTTLSYEPAYQHLVSEESTATEADGGALEFLTSSATWDRGLSVLRTVRDPNWQLSEVFYDGLGRLTSMIAPPVVGCEGTRVPSMRIRYDLTSDPAGRPLSRVTTTTLLSCANYSMPDSQIEAHAYVDGLGRPRAALAEGESDGAAFDDGRPHPFTLSGRQIFTKKGQARLSYQPSYFDGSPDDYAAVIARPGSPYKRALFDAFGRPTVSINEDTTYSSISYHALSKDVCDEVDNGFGRVSTESFAGTCMTERSDGHGRGIDQQLRQVTADGRREMHRLFSYYRADGAVTRVVRALTGDNVLRPETGTAGLTSYVERRFHYDSLGHRIASEDPDTDHRADGNLSTRTWRYLFNPVGDLAAVRDPRGCGQNFYYDMAGRLIGEAYVSCEEAQAGELASADVPAGSVGLGRISVAARVHTRSTFDRYVGDWVNYDGTDAVRGRLTTVEDRGQRATFSYDARGQVTSVSKQIAVIAHENELRSELDGSGRPRADHDSETPADPASVAFAESYERYDMATRYDHAGRVVASVYPRDGGYEVANTYVEGRLSYYRSGAPSRAELAIGDVSYPVVERISYTRDGLPAVTRYGDGAFTGRKATESRTLYDSRRRPVQLFTARTPAAGREAQTLGAVSTVNYQSLNWDGSSNLFLIEDRRIPSEWPAGHKPVDQHIFHDALYRVASVNHEYHTATTVDAATDWREEETRHRAADPMHATAAPMIAAQAQNRVVDLEYSHDWLANMTSWTDDASVFYERSIGEIVNGNDLSPNQTAPTYRPSALYLASNLAPGTTGDRGGWLEADYGVSGNLLSMTVHAQCTNTGAGSCADPGGTNLVDRRRDLRDGCECESEQHYVYRYDELNRLHEGRRYDRGQEQSDWTLAARQRYRYDGANQRTVKQAFDVATGDHRAALTVFPGEFEHRGLRVDEDGAHWRGTLEAESQYLVAGARMVWKNPEPLLTGPNPDYRTSEPPKDALYHWYRADDCPWVTGLGRTCIDRMGHGNLTNGWQDQHPTVDPQGLGGQSALVFGDDSVGLGPGAGSVPVSDEFVIAFVGAIDSSSSAVVDGLAGYDNYRSGDRRDRNNLAVDRRYSPARLWWYSYANYGSYDTPPTESLSAQMLTPVQVGEPFVAVVRGTRTATELYLNGRLAATSGPSEPGIMSTAIGNPGAKRIGEVLMYQRALNTTTELPTLHRYLGNRYGISVGYPNPDPAPPPLRCDAPNLLAAGAGCFDQGTGPLTEYFHQPSDPVAADRAMQIEPELADTPDNIGRAARVRFVAPLPTGYYSHTGGALVTLAEPLQVGQVVVEFDAKHVAGANLLHCGRIWGGDSGDNVVTLTPHWAHYRVVMQLGYSTSELMMNLVPWVIPSAIQTIEPGEFLIDNLVVRQGDGSGAGSTGTVGGPPGAGDTGTPAENVGFRGLDPSHRITVAIGNLIGSTSAVIDLVSGELVEAGGFYPNGAREEWLGASDQVSGARVPLEHVGFTGKEADEEVGVTYFGERYLVSRIGRWATPDPAEIHEQTGGEDSNSYHYVGGNLLQARDPLGLYPFSAHNAQSGGYRSLINTGGIQQRRVELPDYAGAVRDAGHAILDIAGMVPLIGEPADGINGIWYAHEGDLGNAGLSFAGALAPIGGQAITGSRLLAKGTAPLRGLGNYLRTGVYRVTRDGATRLAKLGGAAKEAGEYLVRHKSGLVARVDAAAGGQVTRVRAHLQEALLGGGTRASSEGIGKGTGDDAGHIIAKLLGGGGGESSMNVFAQLTGVNRGPFREFEKEIAGLVRDGRNVQVDIKLRWAGDRVDKVVYEAQVDGATITREFSNKAASTATK